MVVEASEISDEKLRNERIILSSAILTKRSPEWLLAASQGGDAVTHNVSRIALVAEEATRLLAAR